MEKTDLNVSPYYDDFDAEKNFYKVLFKPGFPVQARELTTLQSILQNQISAFGNNIFKDGSVVIPGNISFNRNYYAVKIDPVHLGLDVEFYVDSLVGKKIKGQTSQITAIVQNVVKRIDSTENVTTLYVKYLSANTQFESSQFVDGETLITEETFSYGNTSITSGSTIATLLETNSTSTGSAVSISPGIYFIRGYFVSVAEDTLILDQYTNSPSYRVGLSVFEEVVTAKSDTSLYDNAKGFTNYSAPGSDRFKISTKLSKKLLSDYDDKSFIELLRITDGQVKKIKETTDYSLIKDFLAKRTYEESGNYTLAPFNIEVEESLNNLIDSNGVFTSNQRTDQNNVPSEDLLCVKISSGKAYVGGYDVENTGTVLLDVEKPRTTESLRNVPVPFEMGNLLILNNVSGSPFVGIDNNYSIDLFNYRKSSTISGTGTTIGKARVYSFSSSDSAYVDPSSRFNLYLYDVQTYTVLTLSASLTSNECPETSYIKGLSSGASAYVVGSPNEKELTVSQVSGTFIQNEQITINNNTGITRVVSSIKTYGSQDIKSVYQDSSSLGLSTDFSADTFLQKQIAPNFNITDVITISEGASGISTVTCSGKNFVGIKSDAIIRYQRSGFSTESYARVVSVNNGGLSLTIAPVSNVTNVCVGSLPQTTINSTFFLGESSIKNEDKSYLYSKLGNSNISSVDLGGASLTIKKQVTGKSTSNTGTLNLSASSDIGVSNAYFSQYRPERYALFYSDGVVDPLSSDKIRFADNGATLLISGLRPSQSNITIQVTAIKNVVRNKTKIYKKSESIIIDKTSSSITANLSGLSTSPYYGLRIEDEEISLNVPDVAKIVGIFESLDSNPAQLDRLIFPSGTSLNSTVIVGEYCRGATSNAVGQVISSSSNEVEFVYLNGNKFQPLEVVKFEESKVSSQLTSIYEGRYINKTGDYSLDGGQREQYYDYSRIKRRVGTSSPTKKLTIIFNYYEVDSIDSGDVYTVNSYDSERYKKDIPKLSTNISLSDVLDFRPRVSKFTSIGYSPFAFSSRNFLSALSPSSIIAQNETSSVGYSYYVPRIDRVVLTKTGLFQLIKGNPAINPNPPLTLDDSMDVGIIKYPPYVYNISDIKVTQIENKRYTMKDIGKLEDRIKSLEEFASLTLLELDTKSLQIIDEDGLSRFKCGFFVDNFKTNNFIEISNSDAKSAIDGEKNELTTDVSLYSLKTQILPSENINFESADFSTNIDLFDPNVKKTGDLITLNYNEVEWGDIAQPFATTEENLNPFGLTDFSGNLTLRPSTDSWVRTINNFKGSVVKTQSDWENSYLQNLILSNESGEKLRSRNVEFTAKNLLPSTKYFSSFDGKSDIDIIPKLLKISMVSGIFKSGETVDGYVGSNRVACFRLADLDHKFGYYGNPTEKYTINPYDPTNVLSVYSQSSTIINIDTYSLMDESDGRYYGYTPYGMLLVGRTSGAQATVQNQELITDNYGDLIGCFYIRNPYVNPMPSTSFILGDKTFKLQSQGSSTISYCETSFYVSRNPNSYNGTLVRRPVISRDLLANKHPLIQTFKTDNTGGFLTSIDLFFSEKDSDEKLTLEIRESDLGGNPTKKLLQDYARVSVLPSNIKTSPNGSTPTNIKLNSPLYLEPNKQYCIAIYSPSSSKYKIWTAESNKATVETQTYPNSLQVFYSNQYIGGHLYKSHNGTGPVASLYQDLKFKFYKAQFSQSSGTAYFVNPNLSNNLGEDYDSNIEKLVENPITAYPRKLVIGITTSYGSSAQNVYSIGRKIVSNANSNYGFIEQVGGNILTLTASNVGTGYSDGTFTNVPLYTIQGYGPNVVSASANITISGGKISNVSIASSGEGYALGDMLGITTSYIGKGSNATLSVSARANIDTLYLKNVYMQEFASGTGLSYYDNTTLVSLAGTSTRNPAYVPSDLYTGNVFKVNHYSHGMHANNNMVIISGVSPDTTPEPLQSSLVSSSTVISIANTSNFTTFEGRVVSGINTGYVLINNEIISYYAVNSGSLSILSRGINNSASRNHDPGSLVYKYESNNVSLIRINANHVLPSNSSLLSSLRDADNYYLQFGQYDNVNAIFANEKTFGGGNCKATQNYQFNSIIPKFNIISPDRTSISSLIRTISGTSGGGSEASFLDQGYSEISLNSKNNFNTPRLVASKINETRNLQFIPRSKSLTIGINLQSSDVNLSPVIDLTESTSVALIRNRLNSPITNYSSDPRSNNLVNDPHASVYISKQINLVKPATSLKVITNTYRSSSSNFRVLYKLIRANSTGTDQSYELFPGYNNLNDLNGDGIGDTIINVSLNDGLPDSFVGANQEGEFSEYQFTAQNLDQFVGFSIKIVMSGSNEATPLKFKDIRVIALA
jgi:hypothetical protein